MKKIGFVIVCCNFNNIRYAIPSESNATIPTVPAYHAKEWYIPFKLDRINMVPMITSSRIILWKISIFFIPMW